MVPAEVQSLPTPPPFHFLQVDGVFYPCLRWSFDIAYPRIGPGFDPTTHCFISAWMVDTNNILTQFVAESLLELRPFSPTAPCMIYDIQKARVMSRIPIPYQPLTATQPGPASAG